jgi:hypothetical protein
MTAQIGPFWAASQQFVIECDDENVVADLSDRLRDLGHQPADVADDAADESVVFRLERTGPEWMTHPWALWRDGEPCETSVTDDYLIPYVLWEVTRVVLERTVLPVVPMHAAALAHRGNAVALIGPSHSGKSTLAAWLTRSGWGFLTDEVSLVDTSESGHPVVHPFWRPIGVRRPGPLDDHVDFLGPESEVLLPASELGSLASPAPLVALVCPTYEAGATASLEPLGAAAALALVADQIPSLGRDGAPVFHALAAVVAEVPAFQMIVDDLDEATAQLTRLVERVSAERAHDVTNRAVSETST